MSTITREFTKEQLIEQAKKNIEVLRGAVEKIPGASDAAVIHLKLAEITLASLEAEAVGDVVAWSSPNEERTCDVRLRRHDINPGPLYTAPPAPVSVPDGNGLFPCPFCGGRPEEDAGGCSEYDGHEHQDYSINCKSCGAEVYCAVGSFEKADIPCSCHHGAREVCVEKWNRRAATLPGAEQPQNQQQNIQENIPANTPCKDAPEHIWLQTAGVWPENGEFSELTWCSDNQHPDDTLYVRADVFAGNSPVIPDCSCRTCRPVTFTDSRFVVCPECGNKRCPHANNHRNACTRSNEPGQEGSAYPAAPRQEVK